MEAFDPKAELRRSPVVRPDQVRGVLGGTPSERPTRRFHIVDVRGRLDVVWEVDGYLSKGADGRPVWLLHLICPQCDRLLSVRSDRKAVEVGEGYLEVEEFRCTWSGDFGSPQCGFAAGIVKPKERIIVTDQGPRQIDGMFLRR
jgi:hypothetical protein